MKKRYALLALALLAACSSGEPPPVKYVATPSTKLVLDVAAVNVIDHSAFQPSTSPYNQYRLDPTITQALRQWLVDNVQAGGTTGEALIVIKDASLSSETLPMSQDMSDKWFKRQQAFKYTGHADVTIELQGKPTYATASAEAGHFVSLPEQASQNERQNDYTILLNGLMKDFATNFENGIRDHMGTYVMAGPK